MGKVYYGGPNRRELAGFTHKGDKVECRPKDGGEVFILPLREFRLVYPEYHWGDGWGKEVEG